MRVAGSHCVDWSEDHSPGDDEKDDGEGEGAAPRLLLLVGESSLRTSLLQPGESVTIGRDPECDLLLFHPEISRRHACLHAGGDLEIEDLGSRNGTRLGGRRLVAGERARLELGRHVQLGPYVAVVLATSRDSRAALPIFDPTPAGVPDVVARIARGSATVLITGEPGAGKSVLARTLHGLSGRTGPFVVVGCAGRDEALLEEELFGRGDGADSAGLFEIGAGGTVLLDEIDALPPRLQTKVLRVLKSRIVYRLEGKHPIGVTARVVAATHSPEDGGRATFLEGYLKLNGIVLDVEPLRARRSAIPSLARELLSQSLPLRRRPPGIGAAAAEALMNYDWPGNVRELRGVMERAAVLCAGDEIRPRHLILDNGGFDLAGKLLFGGSWLNRQR